jgi:hypothetical protein
MRGIIAAVAIALAPACSMSEQVQQAKEDSEKARAEIRREFGMDALVSYRVFVGTGGKRLDVQVHFAQPPPGIASKMKDQVTDIVKRTFRDPVTSVVVSM